MLKESLNYTKVADGIVIDLLLITNTIPQKVLELFSHVLCAQRIWVSRILKIDQKYSPWSVLSVSELKAFSAENFELINSVFANVDLQHEIKYSNTNGDVFISKVADILFHVINHSTYHRAQIASLLKQNNIEPPVTDYILLKRNNNL
jgi:uncharacterized damage-inducible protein DinB